MIHSIPLTKHVRTAFAPTPRGVVGVVDDLLDLCQAHELRIHFQDHRCHVRFPGADTQDSLDVPLSRSVFRAVLGRVAALCNEHHPLSVTPYGGEGEIVIRVPVSENGIPPSTCYVAFTNTPSEQRLEIRFSRGAVPAEQTAAAHPPVA